MAGKSKANNGKKSRSTPSVMGFLQKVGGMPHMGSTPAKGLLGDISKEDLELAGRLGAGSQEPTAETDAAATVEAELREPEGAFDHLEDVFADDDAASPRLRRARALSHKVPRTDQETRRVQRFDSSYHVTYRNAGRVEVDLAADISTGGAFVRTVTPLDVGQPLLLTFVDDKHNASLQVAARVKWVTPFGHFEDARPGMGIEFTGLDDSKRSALQKMVDSMVQERL